MDFREIIEQLTHLEKLGITGGTAFVLHKLISCIYGYILRKIPIEETKKYTDENGNEVESTKKYRA